MELIDQHTKSIMEGCKERAREHGLRFDDETLEYIVTNRDILELTPKNMIPTMYDYWVHDVEVLQEKGRYELYPNNPYETVINTRPAVSYYNDNNPDWLNVMIFYHVLGHIDFFQNNIFFKNTWNFDFTGQALSDKRLIAHLRSKHGRWVDYVIEFCRGIDNLVGYYRELNSTFSPEMHSFSERLDYFFDVFLQQVRQVTIHDYIGFIERYNGLVREHGPGGEQIFFGEIGQKFAEFEALFRESSGQKRVQKQDLLEFLLERSPFLNKNKNKWMKSIIHVIRNTSLYFQPQIRTKIMNEGWASYWHEKLFLLDDRIKGHEVDFARVNAGVTAMPRVGLNPYALGMRLFFYIEDMANKGRLTYDYDRLRDERARQNYNTHLNEGQQAIFSVRENFNDYVFISTFVDQDFMKLNKLFVVGRHLDQQRMVWQYYVKSRKVQDYRHMLFDALYHPPHIVIDEAQSSNSTLYLKHVFEGKPLVRDYISNTMLGLEFLWGGPIKLETTEVFRKESGQPDREKPSGHDESEEYGYRRVLYSMDDHTLSKVTLSAEDDDDGLSEDY
ncbi:SpoVR family protein [bacterium]|nr:SpoVR family protein [bacterium]